MSANGRAKSGGHRLVGHYDQLSASERFRLVLEADARDDHGESARLVGRCPGQTYTMAEASFVDRIEASRDVVIGLMLELGYRTAERRMLRGSRVALLQVVRATLEVAAKAAGEPPPTDEEVESETVLVAAFSNLEEDARAKAAAVYAAFSAVCREQMVLEPETVIGAHFGPLALEDLALHELEGVEPERERVDLWRDAFACAWARRVEP